MLRARVAVRGDDLGDVQSMQSFFIPDLAVDTVPTVPADELYDIVMTTGHPYFANGAFDFTRGPFLTVMHTNVDFCSGSLMWSFNVMSTTGRTYSFLVDAHRGTVHGFAPLDLESMANRKIYNFKGNHIEQTDETNCDDGTQDCYWFSTDPITGAVHEQGSFSPAGAGVNPVFVDLLRLNCSMKCWDEGALPGGDNNCGNVVGPDFFPYQEDDTTVGDFILAYDSNDWLFQCPGHVENHPNNPWSMTNWTNPPVPSFDQRYHACRWLSDDLQDLGDWVWEMSNLIASPSITTPSGVLYNDVPDVEIMASEPVDPATFAFTAATWDPWRDDSVDLGVGVGQRQNHFPHYPSTGSAYFSAGGGWGSPHIMMNPRRYNYLNMIGGGGEERGADDVLYHEFGHYLYHGVPGSHYEYTTGINPFDAAECGMWRGVYTETGPDLVGAVLENRRWMITEQHIDKPDWIHSEGTGGRRDLQHPDRSGATRRAPESFNDFHFVREPGDPVNFSGENESEIHTTAGMINRFYFLLGNNICDLENGCGAGSHAYSNAGRCSCWMQNGSTLCDNSGGTYDRDFEKWHTIEPASSCLYHGAVEDPLDMDSAGFQQWHNGVRVTSLDQTHVDGGVDGAEMMGRIHARMLFEDGPDWFELNDRLPFDFMDAFYTALISETGYAWPDPFEEEALFYRARDSVGFWTSIGNYFENLNPNVVEEGITGALINWDPGPSTPIPENKWNSEWLFGFNPLNNRIGLALRGCWNSHEDTDGDRDYCFDNPNWLFMLMDQPIVTPFGPLVPHSVPAVDINDDGDPSDPNHGLWLVHRSTIGAAAIDIICRRIVPVFPNVGAPSARACDIFHHTTLRPAAGHYTVPGSTPVETREVIVYADVNDYNRLKSFEWGVAGSDKTIPPGQGTCGNTTKWRPEVVTHDDGVLALWIGKGDRSLCYSWYKSGAPTWKPAMEIPFEEREFTSCGDNNRFFAGPPSATVRNGVVNVAVRDLDANGGAPWVWMIQLDDIDGDYEFWDCEHVPECDGSCSADCHERVLWEERSPWVPHTEFHASPTSPEVGGFATTEHLIKMKTTATQQRQDYTFFYNPTTFINAPGTTPVPPDLAVWVRESW